ncbi:HEPN domain-containing protein [Neobacillus soli]|uniref:HEPN domain-containing protein n=1 Tax=Neobacillus soli TaxID=220688 RepID=UPI00082576AB|nr:HEPN domain-containing protein [Neobacillus soli]
MKYLFIARLYGLKINKVLSRGIQIDGNIRISNDRNRLDRLCDTFFQKNVGTLEFDSLYNGPYVYAEGDFPEHLNPQDGNDTINFLNYNLRLSQTIGVSLWFVKDNSVRTETGFLYVFNESYRGVSSNARTSYFTNAKGQIDDIKFSNEEITQGVNMFIKTFNEGTTAELDHLKTSEVITTVANRLERFIYFLQAARNQGFPPSRISMYCTLLETLLSTDNQEIGHKIAERTSRLLGKDYSERMEIFKFIKEAYAIRSANVHGDKLSRKFRKIEKQIEISMKFDKYVRKLIQFIIADQSKMELYLKDENEGLNDWFNQLILT